jgi:hypothetical protein
VAIRCISNGRLRRERAFYSSEREETCLTTVVRRRFWTRFGKQSTNNVIHRFLLQGQGAKKTWRNLCVKHSPVQKYQLLDLVASSEFKSRVQKVFETKLYRIQLWQALPEGDKKRYAFCEQILNRTKKMKTVGKIDFRDEATFQVIGLLNRHCNGGLVLLYLSTRQNVVATGQRLSTKPKLLLAIWPQTMK